MRPDYEVAGARAIVDRKAHHTGGWSWVARVLPSPQAENRFGLYQQVFSDVLVLTTVCFAPSWLSTKWGLPWETIPIYAVLVTLFGFSEGLYQEDQTPKALFLVLTRSVVIAMLLVVLPAWARVTAPAAVLTIASSVAGLVLWRHLVAWRHCHLSEETHNVLIVGSTPAGRAIASALRNDAHYHAIVCGFVDDHAQISAEVLGRVEDLDWLARSQFIDEVIVALPGENALAREVAHAAYRNHLDIRVVPDLPPGIWSEARVERIGDVPVVTLHREPVPGPKLFLKRLLDIAGGLVALTLTMPVIIVAALAIQFDSPGPILYVARRVGTKGRSFRCYKLRSMVADADQRKETLRVRNERAGPIFKLEDDPRITRVGRFLRRYSLDELPQLWNILRGDMSLVGPRPHPLEEVLHYELHHYRRLDVKPGLTGLWQVSARKNPSFDLNMHLDLTYIENWTLLLDLRILVRTVRVLFAPEGA